METYKNNHEKPRTGIIKAGILSALATMSPTESSAETATGIESKGESQYELVISGIEETIEETKKLFELFRMMSIFLPNPVTPMNQGPLSENGLKAFQEFVKTADTHLAKIAEIRAQLEKELEDLSLYDCETYGVESCIKSYKLLAKLESEEMLLKFSRNIAQEAIETKND